MQRIPLPGAEMLEEEPLYVNAKQYHRILKRRQARAKLEAEGKIPKERRVGEMLLCILFTQVVVEPSLNHAVFRPDSQPKRCGFEARCLQLTRRHL